MDGITIIHESSFFSQHPHRRLPPPEEVRHVNAGQPDALDDRPPFVIYDRLGLIVKYGRGVSVLEARTQIMMRERLGDQVPVPEVFAWGHNGDEMFIYMALLVGETLEDRWPGMADPEREAVCTELRHMVRTWRRMRPDSPLEPYIGEYQLTIPVNTNGTDIPCH